jgi:tetratricopeptide (TPR) repeat protein
LTIFYKACHCEEIREKYADFFNGYRFTLRDRLYVPPESEGEDLSYRERKRILLQRHKDVIDYIESVYNAPLSELESKYLSNFKREKLRIGMIVPCEWHMTVLAQRGSSLAQLILGNRILSPEQYKLLFPRANVFATGPGAFKNGFNEEAFQQDMKWLIIAGKSGETAAYYILGRASKEAKAWESAINWFKQGAEAGDAPCMFEMGEIARTQLHDYALALKWYEDAAHLGHYQGMKYSAEILSEDTKNTKKDYEKAIFYYQELIQKEQTNKNPYYQFRIEEYQREIKKIQLKMDE